ncbi:hypothetical protein CHELA20_51409 [Hyphomicrobiales bacterium]|nr:hypothetical protein CHELA20_51409 [Hyphomicrobiales bacterium]
MPASVRSSTRRPRRPAVISPSRDALPVSTMIEAVVWKEKAAIPVGGISHAPVREPSGLGQSVDWLVGLAFHRLCPRYADWQRSLWPILSFRLPMRRER